HMAGSLIVCAMDARRKQVYNALFLATGTGLERLTPDRAISLEDLGAELTKLPVNELDRLPLTPDLLEALRLYARISNREGKRRQLQFIGRLMREVDAGPLAEAIEARKNGQQADAARLHLAEQWREKLLSAAEADVEDLLAAFPWPDAEAAGRPELEKLLAEARKEDDRRPPHARRALFRGIMRLLEQR
ncbi:ribosome biogenesis factor YjgA, partial [Desulfovibrio sp.]|uniref:ribosome biogenesis factor YjgA n=2 Tax=Desulfovibrio sp. TaxID=885 RepID=UPI00307F75B7